MESISKIISDIIKSIAEIGAGVASAGFCYEPNMPESLKK